MCSHLFHSLFSTFFLLFFLACLCACVVSTAVDAIATSSLPNAPLSLSQAIPPPLSNPIHSWHSLLKSHKPFSYFVYILHILPVFPPSLLSLSLYSSGFCAYYCFCGNFTVAWLSNLYIISTSRKYTCNKRLFTFSHSSISYSALQIPLCQCHTTTAHPSVLLLLHNILLNGSVCWLYFTKGMTLKEWNSWESAKAKALTILSIHNTYSTDKHT